MNNLQTRLDEARDRLIDEMRECDRLKVELAALKAELAAPIDETSLRSRNDGALPVGRGCMLVRTDEWLELSALKAKIEAAPEFSVSLNLEALYSTNLSVYLMCCQNLEPGETRSYRMLEVTG